MPNSDTTVINILHSNIKVPVEPLVIEVIGSYGINLSNEQAEKVQRYIGLLLLWNQKLSLTSISDHREILARHFGESLFASKIIDFGASRLADVGPGAGFPGLALKIILPGMQVFLIEQHAKKCAFLNEAARLLGFQNVKVVRSTYEALPPDLADFNFIASRAVGDHKNMLKWANSRLKAAGKVVLWLGSADAAKVMSIPGWVWDPPYSIPSTRNSVILTGKYS